MCDERKRINAEISIDIIFLSLEIKVDIRSGFSIISLITPYFFNDITHEKDLAI